MSAPANKVDVLAVMRRYAEVFDPNNGRDGKDMAEAIDAVAELVVAIRNERSVRDNAAIGRAATLDVIEATKRTGAALASFGAAP